MLLGRGLEAFERVFAEDCKQALVFGSAQGGEGGKNRAVDLVGSNWVSKSNGSSVQRALRGGRASAVASSSPNLLAAQSARSLRDENFTWFRGGNKRLQRLRTGRRL